MKSNLLTPVKPTLMKYNTIKIFIIFVLSFFYLTSSFAQNRAYEIYFDTDSDQATGCTVIHQDLEEIIGVDAKLTITTDNEIPSVLSTHVYNCSNADFIQSSNTVISSVGFNTGNNGEDVFESKLLFSDIGINSTNSIKTFFATTHDTAEDVVTEKSPGTPIVIINLDPIQIPGLGIIGLFLLALFIYTISKKKIKKISTLMVYLFMISPLVWAFTIIIDGQTTDWERIELSASDPVGDTSNPGEFSDITSVYAVSQEDTIYLRMDIVDVENQAPLANNTTATTLEDNQITIQLTGQDDNNDNLTFAIEQAPLNGILSTITLIDSTTSEVTFTPNADYNGTDSFTFSSNDGKSTSPIATAEITITAVNDAPSFIAGADITVAEDSGLYQQIWASNIIAGPLNESGQQLTFVVSNTDASLFSDQPSISSTGQLQFQPLANANGVVTVNVFLEDDGGTANGGVDSSIVQSFSINITSVIDVPVANNQSLIIDEDTSVNIQLTAFDPDGDTLNYQVDTQPTHGLLSGLVPNVIYTPATNYNGSDAFSFHANDGVNNSNIAVISIIINPINDAPVSLDQNLLMNENSSLPLTLMGTDPENDVLSYSVISNPQNGNLTGILPNLIYTPNLNYNGNDSFLFLVNDGNLNSNSSQINIVINPVNSAPIAQNQSLVTDESTLLPITLQATDPEGDILSYTLISQPQNGKIIGSPPELLYLPFTSFEGSDNFDFIANDGAINSLNATIDISILDANDAPIADPQNLNTEENTTINIVLTGSDPENATLTYQIASLPEHGTLSGTGQNISYTPNSFYEGIDSFDFIVNDGEIDSTTATVTIEIISHGNNPPFFITEPIITLNVQDSLLGNSELVTLENWVFEDLDYFWDPQQRAVWNFNADFTIATQLINGRGSVILSDFDFSNQQISGTFSVNTNGDDDYIGFVFGWHNRYQYYQFDWKKSPQEGNPRGMAIRRINLSPDGSDGDPVYHNSFQSKNSPTLFRNNIPWVPFTNYKYTLSFQNGEFSISVIDTDNNTQMDSFTIYDDTFDNGKFGFYNLSQHQAQYSGFERQLIADETYYYPSQAIDPDGDNVVYSLQQAPTGMQINPQTGALTWQTTSESVGVHHMVVVATDTFGATGTQEYDLMVINNDPIIISQPIIETFQDRPYAYDVEAFDPNPSDVITYSLVTAPVGMTITSITGVIQWAPTVAELGDHNITVKATDLDGNQDTQDYILSVVVPESNTNPEFTSNPITNAQVGKKYVYTPTATDADGDATFISMVDIPYGMKMFDGINITWTPTSNQVTTHTVTIEVNDSRGAKSQQTFEINVTDASTNHAPNIFSTPESIAVVDQLYTYQVSATDPDGDDLVYVLLNAVDQMTIDPQSGLLSWQPKSSDIGFHNIIIKVSDAQGGFIRQEYQLAVFQFSQNSAPQILSSPVQTTENNQIYQYQLIALDQDGDSLNYTLLNSPAGMSINNSGLIEFTPNAITTHNIIVNVDDQKGGIAQQSYDLQIITNSDNSAPIITSLPVLAATQDEVYQYDVIATDADNDTLTYSLLSSPVDMSIDMNTGVITWIPTTISIQDIEVMVTDGFIQTTQSWQLQVVESGGEYTAQIILSPATPLVGDDINVFVIPQSAGINPTIEIIHNNGTPITNNPTTLVNVQQGVHLIEAVITGSNGQITVERPFTVIDPNDLLPPEIDIITPTDGSTATGVVDISIRVQDTDLSLWRLSYRDASDEAGVNAPRTTLAEGTNPVNDTTVANWDTSQLRNGIYVLILEAIDTNGQANNITNSIFIEGDLKIGNFQIAFEDLNIPVAGIPVTITRSYDTRNRNADEAFGKGWEIGYQSLQLTESRIPGLGWYRTTEYYNIGPVSLPRYCIESIGDRLVSVRMPDGSLEKFKVMAKTLNPTSDERSNCQDIVPSEFFNVQFRPQGDTNSTLTSNDIAGNVKVTNGNLQTLIGTQPIDPNKYTLTLLDGTKYSIDQGFNLTDIETTDGNSIKFTHNGIEHNNGYSVTFIRDSQDRITAIRKPNGEEILYTYNANGDLTSHTDLMGNTTTFTYILDHYLEEINDPRGIMVARNEYDADGRLIAHVDAQGNRIEYTHDIAGRTETITDRNGNSSVFVYDNAGSVIAETNALGETTYHEYNNIRLETKQTDPLGNETNWTYDNFGNQLTETDALGNTTTSTYNNRGEILSQTDAAGNDVITNVYSDQNNPYAGGGNLTTVTDALGNNTNFHWTVGQDGNLNTVVVNTGFTDAKSNRYEVSPITSGTNNGITGTTTDLNGLKTQSTYDDEARPLTQSQIITDSSGVEIARYTTTFEYNKNGDIITTTDDLGHITRTEYNSLNKVSATIDADGNRTTYEFDNRGNPSKTTYPDGTFETTTYDNEGNAISTTDRAGRITKTIYDAANRVVEVIMPDETPLDDTDNPRTTNTYDGAGRLTAVTDALGNSTSYGYDTLGRRTATSNALGNTTSFVYDNLGRRSQSTDSLGRITNFEYNTLGNLTKTTFPNGTFTTTTYDELSRKTTQTDLAGHITTYEYSDAGNLTAVIDTLGNRTEYTYDQRGNKITQKDAKNNVTTWAYDELSRVQSRSLPDGQSETFTYNNLGNLASKTDFNGDTTTYIYNNLSQLVLTTYQDGTTVANTYTTTGQIDSMTDARGVTTYQYDVQNRLTRLGYPDGNFIQYQYDKNGNRTLLTTAHQVVAYTYDALNRSSTVTDTQGITTYTYDAVGNRATQVNANGTTATYSYDLLNRLTNLVHTNSSNSIIASYAYTLGANGNRTRIEEATGRIVDYTYDNLYRLLTETVTDPINGNHFNQWGYDDVGNRLQQEKDGIVTTYIYDNNDKLQSETQGAQVTSYTYDNNGNTLTKTIDASLDTTYSYNKDNRMTQAVTPTSTITNIYDAGGIRQAQSVDGVVTNYLIDQNRSYAQVLEEQNDLFIPQTTYVYGDDLINQTQGGVTHTFGYDGLGSTRILTDVAGVVQNAYGYEAFGEVDYQLGTVPNNYLFTGEQYDNNVGFYYLRARFYNPQNGRFVNMDTFAGMGFEPKSLHKYLYGNANPVMFIDPSGNFSIGQLVTAQNVNAISNSYAVASIAVQFATGNFAGGAIAVAEEIVYSKLGAFRPVAKQSEKLIKLFGNIWGRGVKLKLGLKANSTTLRHNMQELLGSAPANHQAHHLVAGTSQAAQQSRNILKKYDIDINSPSNGVFLPDCSFRRGGGGISAVHCGRHRRIYDDLVVEILSSADSGGKAAVISALTNIRLQLLSGELALNAAQRL